MAWRDPGLNPGLSDHWWTLYPLGQFVLKYYINYINCPEYDTKQSDGEFPVMLELWGMQSTLSLPSLPGPLCPGVVAPDRARSIG